MLLCPTVHSVVGTCEGMMKGWWGLDEVYGSGFRSAGRRLLAVQCSQSALISITTISRMGNLHRVLGRAQKR